MSLRVWNPFVELTQLENNIRKAFDSFPTFIEDFSTPLTDIKESEDGYTIHMNIPGISKDNITIDATSDFIEISAEAKTEEQSEKDESKSKLEYKPTHIERYSQKYYRKIHFDTPIDASTGKVSLQDGVLTIAVQKRPEAKKVSLSIN